eukprot:2828145-Prymnesium_polylepis.1
MGLALLRGRRRRSARGLAPSDGRGSMGATSHGGEASPSSSGLEARLRWPRHLCLGDVMRPSIEGDEMSPGSDVPGTSYETSPYFGFELIRKVVVYVCVWYVS